MSHDKWLRQATEVLADRNMTAISNTCAQAADAIAELKDQLKSAIHSCGLYQQRNLELQAKFESTSNYLCSAEGYIATLEHRATAAELERDRLKSCEVDAKRYRWIRGIYSPSARRKTDAGAPYHDLLWASPLVNSMGDPAALDYWIDAQMPPAPTPGEHHD